MEELNFDKLIKELNSDKLKEFQKKQNTLMTYREWEICHMKDIFGETEDGGLDTSGFMFEDESKEEADFLEEFKKHIGKKIEGRHRLYVWNNMYDKFSDDFDDTDENIPYECNLIGVPGKWCSECPYAGTPQCVCDIW